MPVIRVEKATKQYNDEGRTLYAVLELSLTVEQGDFVFLIGSSGAGRAPCSSSSAASCPRTRGRSISTR